MFVGVTHTLARLLLKYQILVRKYNVIFVMYTQLLTGTRKRDFFDYYYRSRVIIENISRVYSRVHVGWGSV